MIKFYLNTVIRSKEYQVIVQPTSSFLTDKGVEILFLINPKKLYFQHFIEKQNVDVNKENFINILNQYISVLYNYEDKLLKERYVYVDDKSIDELPNFYVNKPYIEIEDIIECCKMYASIHNEEKIEVYLNDKLPLYINNELINTELVLNNRENILMDIDILKQQKLVLDKTDTIILNIIDKWLDKEMKLHSNIDELYNNMMIPVEEKEAKYFMFNEELFKKIETDVIQSLKLNEFLSELYGEEKAQFYLNKLDTSWNC